MKPVHTHTKKSGFYLILFLEKIPRFVNLKSNFFPIEKVFAIFPKFENFIFLKLIMSKFSLMLEKLFLQVTHTVISTRLGAGRLCQVHSTSALSLSVSMSLLSLSPTPSPLSPSFCLSPQSISGHLASLRVSKIGGHKPLHGSSGPFASLVVLKKVRAI